MATFEVRDARRPAGPAHSMDPRDGYVGTDEIRARWPLALMAAAVMLVGPITASAADGETAAYDKLWSHAQLYEGHPDSLVQGVQLSGRLQLDHAYVDAGDEELSHAGLRRLRFGAKVSLRNNILLHAEADYDWQSGQPVYKKLTDAYIGWKPSKAVNLRVGKHSAPFTLDGMTSSTKLETIDRGNLANNIWFTQEYIPGVSVGGDVDKWTYHVGLYSSGESNRGFGDSNGGEFWLGTIGYDLGERWGVDKALLRLNLVDNEPDVHNGFTKPFEKIASLSLLLGAGRWGLGADLSAARGYFGQSDLRAFMVQPTYALNGTVQLVGRYTYISSDEENGVRLPRYEGMLVDGRGDGYDELYLGVNYYLYGHKLKLQTGLEYADMTDRARDGGAYRGWSWTTGFRMSW
jgi:phosphate-selective porin OprO/OprP